MRLLIFNNTNAFKNLKEKILILFVRNGIVSLLLFKKPQSLKRFKSNDKINAVAKYTLPQNTCCR